MRTMNTKEIAESLNVSKQYVQEKARELFPELVRNGVATQYNEFHATAIKNAMKDNPYLPQVAEVITTVDKLEAISKSMVYLNELLTEEKQKTEQLRFEKEKAESTVNLLVHDTKKTYTVSELAKEVGLKSAQELNEKLHDLGIQYKVNGTWLLYVDHSLKGYTENGQEVILKNGIAVYNMRWTGKGRLFILKLKEQGKILKTNLSN